MIGANQWEAINCKQITRWQHVSQLKASSFGSWQQKSLLLKTQQLILGTGTAIWWLTEPHCLCLFEEIYSFHLSKLDHFVIIQHCTRMV
jgi:hypothetical protein